MRCFREQFMGVWNSEGEFMMEISPKVEESVWAREER